MVAHIVNLVLGAWLLFAPRILGYLDPTAVRNSVWMAVGVLAFSALSLASLLRAHHANTFIGIWLMVAPFIIGYGYGGDTRATLNELLVGAAVLIVSFFEARADERRPDRRVAA